MVSANNQQKAVELGAAGGAVVGILASGSSPLRNAVH